MPCFLGENIKYLGKCSKKQKHQPFARNRLCMEVSEPWHVQVLLKRRAELISVPGPTGQPCPRASVSDSSEGEITTGETTEEVFEESEI